MPTPSDIGQEAEQRLLAAAEQAHMWPRNLLFSIREYLRGGSCREIAYKAGVSFNYIRKLNKLAHAIGIHRKCPCGRLLDHSGWCVYRVKRNAIGFGEMLNKARRDVDKPDYMVKIEKITAGILWIDLRNDIRQELALAHLEGKLDPKDFAKAAKAAKNRLTVDKYTQVSLTNPLLSDELCLIELMVPPKPVDPNLFRNIKANRARLSMNGKKAAVARWGKKK